MAFRKSDRRTDSSASCFDRQIVLLGIVALGLMVTGCGGTSGTSEDSASSAGGAESADAAPDETMMAAEMSAESTMDPATSNPANMQQSMEHGAAESFEDPALAAGETTSETDFSGTADSAVPGDSSVDPNEVAMREAELASSTTDTLDPASTETTDPNEAAMLAAEAAGSTDTAAATSDPNEAAMLAATTTDTAAGTEPSSFGAEGQGTDPSLNGSGGAAQAQEPPADSPDYPAFKVVMGLMQGKHDGLKEFVSTTGRGLIEKIRSGSLTTTEKDELKKTFAQPQLVGQPRTIRGSRTVNLNSGGQLISIVSKKQGSNWKVSSITIREPKRR